MKVLTHIGGAKVVVMLPNGDYLEAGKSQQVNVDKIEVVMSGRVIATRTVDSEEAPESIIELLRHHFKYWIDRKKEIQYRYM